MIKQALLALSGIIAIIGAVNLNSGFETNPTLKNDDRSCH